jgi:hypothetical protein
MSLWLLRLLATATAALAAAADDDVRGKYVNDKYFNLKNNIPECE